MTAIKDDYDGYIAHIKAIPTDNVRKDTMTIIKWVMIKRTLIKIAELIIIAMSITGILPSFLG